LGIDDQMPSKFSLHNNYPNPFNPKTTIRFDIPEETMVKLIIYDVSGKEVNVLTAGTLKAGSYRVRWNGKDHSGHGVSAGMYLYHIDAGEFSDTKKLILLK
jgi:flagellar hook assembly protein FlgD